jgi:hypothetical protein
LPSESDINEIKDGIIDVDEFLTASSENGLFEGHKAETNTEQMGEFSTRYRASAVFKDKVGLAKDHTLIAVIFWHNWRW